MWGSPLRTVLCGALALVAGGYVPCRAVAADTPHASHARATAHASLVLAATRASRAVPAAQAEPTRTASLSPAMRGAAPAARDLPRVQPPFDDGRVPFSLSFDGIESSLGTLSAFVLPGATLEVAAVGGSGSFAAQQSGGKLVATGPASWRWTAPDEHGDHDIRIRDLNAGSGVEARLHVFVLHPYDGSDNLGSYRVGHYQEHPKDDDPAYRRPDGLVEVTEGNLDTMVSPHFRLGQFVCKDDGGYPKYIALRTALLVKLETLLETLAAHGLPAESLHVMSGYRTPAYNAGIGNETIYSRHTYGDAADVFLDRDGDGIEDDLDHDGRSTRQDAQILYELAEDTLDQQLPAEMAGGLSAYGPSGAHGPFLHIDARGKRARW